MTTTAVGPVGLDQQVEARLTDVLADAGRRAVAFGPHYVLLWSEIARTARGGKRFRSAIVLDTHAALGGTRTDDAVSVACGFELLHTAFLIHDDLIDGDTVRRGRPNLAATMRDRAAVDGHDQTRSQRWSDAAAVLAGDLALSQAHRLVGSVGVGPAARAALLDLLDETLLVSAGGELADTAFGLGLQAPTLAESLLVAESKTAMYSFRAPLRAGGILADAAPVVLRELDDVGRLLGRSFQLVDDLLGVFAPEEVTGKSNLSDLREGKRTPLMEHARTEPVWAVVVQHLGRPDLDHGTAADLRQALARSAAPETVRRAAWVDLVEVVARTRRGSLPPTMAEVVLRLSDQVGAALADAARYVEEARWPR